MVRNFGEISLFLIGIYVSAQDQENPVRINTTNFYSFSETAIYVESSSNFELRLYDCDIEYNKQGVYLNNGNVTLILQACSMKNSKYGLNVVQNYGLISIIDSYFYENDYGLFINSNKITLLKTHW